MGELIPSIAFGFGLPFGVAGKLLITFCRGPISLTLSFSLANVQEQMNDGVGWHQRMMDAGAGVNGLYTIRRIHN